MHDSAMDISAEDRAKVEAAVAAIEDTITNYQARGTNGDLIRADWRFSCPPLFQTVAALLGAAEERGRAESGALRQAAVRLRQQVDDFMGTE